MLYLKEICGLLLIAYLFGTFTYKSPWIIPDDSEKTTNFFYFFIYQSIIIVVGLGVVFYFFISKSDISTVELLNLFFLFLTFFIINLILLKINIWILNEKIKSNNSQITEEEKDDTKIKFFRNTPYLTLYDIPIRILLLTYLIPFFAIIYVSYSLSLIAYNPDTLPPIGNCLFVVSAFFICLHPTSSIVKRTLSFFMRDFPNTKKINGNDAQTEEIYLLGKYMGWVEMSLTLSLVLLRAYEVLGFLIVAKTYIEYKSNTKYIGNSKFKLVEENSKWKEIFVFGTLLSITIAIIIGIILLLVISD